MVGPVAVGRDAARMDWLRSVGRFDARLTAMQPERPFDAVLDYPSRQVPEWL